MKLREGVPTATTARRLMKSLQRATRKSAWWKLQESQLRHCLRCGGRLAERDVPEERRRRLVCKNCRFISYRNPKVVAATLPLRNGRIYLLRRDIEPSRGRWTFPAGYMEMGESIENAAVRETWEEIRCRVKSLALQKIYSYKDADVVTVVYRARVRGPDPRPGREAQCVQAFRPSEIPWGDLAFRSTFHALRDWVISRKR